jgi:hypothetical protein
MKKTMVLMGLLALSVAAGAQANEVWKLLADKKVVFVNDGKDANSIVLPAKTMNTAKTLTLLYPKPADAADNNRTIYLETDNGEAIAQQRLPKNYGNFVFKMATLKAKLKGTGVVKIYSASLPNDPEIAKRVRVGRIMLGTVIIK